MPNPLTAKAPEKIFVKVGDGRKVPLPIPGTNVRVPAEGLRVVKDRAVLRLLRVGDLVQVDAPAALAVLATKVTAKEG